MQYLNQFVIYNEIPKFFGYHDSIRYVIKKTDICFLCLAYKQIN